MALATRPSRKRPNRGLVFEQIEHRRMMAGDVAAMQPAVVISDDAQYMVELVNQARSNPLAEAQRQGIDLNQGLAAGSISDLPKQPLAPNQSLVDAALAHSEDMLDNQYFDHTGQNGSSPSTRAQDAGYSTGAAENIALNSMSGRNLADVVAASHDMLFQSAGHRQNLLHGYMSDIGIGNAAGDWTYNNGASYSSVLSTQMFGREGNTVAALTGVAYTDAVIDDDFYTPGEGMGDVMIEAVSTSGARYTTQTGTSGGYTLHLPAGQYSVRASDTVSKTVAILDSVQIGTTNVKLDWLPELFTPAGDDDKSQPDGSPPRTTVPADGHNLDVNGDNVISPNDVLIVINHLANSEMTYRPELDVNRDDSVSPLDALIIINQLNETTLTSTDSIETEEVVSTEVSIATDDSRLAEGAI